MNLTSMVQVSIVNSSVVGPHTLNALNLGSTIKSCYRIRVNDRSIEKKEKKTANYPHTERFFFRIYRDIWSLPNWRCIRASELRKKIRSNSSVMPAEMKTIVESRRSDLYIIFAKNVSRCNDTMNPTARREKCIYTFFKMLHSQSISSALRFVYLIQLSLAQICSRCTLRV